MKKPRPAQPPSRARQVLAEHLELEDAAHRGPALQMFLDMGAADLALVYRAELMLGPYEQANLYFLEYVAVLPTGDKNERVHPELSAGYLSGFH